MRVVITTNHLKFSSLYLQNAASVRAFNVVRQEKLVVGFSGNVYTGTINRLNLSDGSVEERHLSKGAVTTPILADQSVTEAKIRDSNVTLQKLEPSIRNVFREIKPHTNIIVATKDANEDYHVIRRIYAKDFMVENTDGSLGSIQSMLIDDAKTTGSTTWSSVYIAGRFNEKSDTGHTHEIYSLVSHNHDDLYSARSHNHDGVYSPTWHDHDTRYYTQYQTDTKLSTLKGEVIVASKDARMDYHVEQKIYAKDFVVENADGSLSDIQSTIIDDTQTTNWTTWSSVLINSMLGDKSDTGHTHDGYSLASHTHLMTQISDFPVLSDWVKHPVKPTYSASEVGAAPALHDHTTLPYVDSRTIDYTPNDIHSQGIGLSSVHLKNNWLGGVRDGGNFYSSMYISPWGDSSGGKVHQLIFTDNDNVWHRAGSTTSWGTWQKMWHSSNSNKVDADWTANILRTSNAIIHPKLDGNYNEGIRLVLHSNGWSNIHFGTDASDKGFISNQWIIGKRPDNTFVISAATNESGTTNFRVNSSGVAYCKDIIALG